jgi:phosphohistidine phosphatase SixA
VRVLLVRHARAGEREKWEGDDRLRPLDERGQRQAILLAPLLREEAATQLLSSPYVRCVQTLAPAAAQGLPLELQGELAEGAVREDVLRLLRSLAPEGVPALCTHGDVIAELIGDERKAAKGSVWELEVEVAGGRISPLRYLPPPA